MKVKEMKNFEEDNIIYSVLTKVVMFIANIIVKHVKKKYKYGFFEKINYDAMILHDIFMRRHINKDLIPIFIWVGKEKGKGIIGGCGPVQLKREEILIIMIEGIKYFDKIKWSDNSKPGETLKNLKIDL